MAWEDLRGRAEEVRELLGMLERNLNAPTAAELKKEAIAYGNRRADREGSRDNLIYRSGYANDAAGLLAIPDLLLTAILSSASLLQDALRKYFPDGAGEGVRVVDVVQRLLEDPTVVAWARAEGEWLQWKRLKALAEDETARFMASDAYKNPKASWRRKKPTRNQVYMIGEICRISGAPRLSMATREEAFSLIDDYGGNPRFKGERPRPPRLERQA